MTYITFIANLGGMLGLCMGFSFFSVFEVVFYAAQYGFDSMMKCGWVGGWIKWKQQDILGKFTMVSKPIDLLHVGSGQISSSWVKIRLHTKNQLPRLPGSALKGGRGVHTYL